MRLDKRKSLSPELVSSQKLTGLFTKAFTLIAVVIEAKIKPVPANVPCADPTLRALGLTPANIPSMPSILAITKQDRDIFGLNPPPGIKYLGASSNNIDVQTLRSHPSVGR